MKYAKKSGKLKSQKLFKSQKLSKSRKLKSKKLAKSKKLLKSENSSNFGVMEAGPNFLTPNARITFNRLWLTFIKVPILWYFDPQYHIKIKTDALGYAINGVLN